MKAWKLSVAASFAYFVVMTGVLSVDDGAEQINSPQDVSAVKTQTRHLQKEGPSKVNSSAIFQYTGDNTTRVASAASPAAQNNKPASPSKNKKTQAHTKKAGPSVLKSAPEKMVYSAATAAASGAED